MHLELAEFGRYTACRSSPAIISRGKVANESRLGSAYDADLRISKSFAWQAEALSICPLLSPRIVPSLPNEIGLKFDEYNSYLQLSPECPEWTAGPVPLVSLN